MAKKIKTQSNKKIVQICPVCRNKKMLTIHHILPKFIFREIETPDRVYFLNGDNSYWLCTNCHCKYEKRADALKDGLLKEFSFPENSITPFILDDGLRMVRNLSRYMTGKYSKNNYNFSIYQSYEAVRKFYGKKYLTYDEILEYSDMNDTIPNEKYINRGKFLINNVGVEKLDELFRNDLIGFLTKRSVKQGNLIPEKNKHYEI